MRHVAWPGPPSDAARYKQLQWVLATQSDGRATVKAWRGRAQKPTWYLSFKTVAAAERWIEEHKAGEDQLEALYARQKADNDAHLAKMLDQIQVGTILHYSWGYDQTQCDYFQVVERHGRNVLIESIASEQVEGSEGFMCDRRRPIPDAFTGTRLRKRITPSGVTMDHGNASPCEPTADFYCSWYA